MGEGDETPPAGSPLASPANEDNSLGRLLALSDGVFAIALTLLALDLKVPQLGAHPSDAHLAHALGAKADTYFSFALTFYVVSLYWIRHRRVFRSVTGAHAALVRDTLALLLVVAAMPFFASLLGTYGSVPISLTLYGAANVVAMLTLALTSWDVRRLGMAGPAEPGERDYHRSVSTWVTVGVFVLCVPAGFLLGRHGPLVLLLLLIPGRIPRVSQFLRRQSLS